MLRITITLIMAALVALSTAFVVKPHRQDDSNTLSGFTFKQRDVSLTAASGAVYFYIQHFVNSTSWEFNSAGGVNRIVRQSYPRYAFVNYKDTEAKVGDVTDVGALTVFLADSACKVELAARDVDGKCKLEPSIKCPELAPVFYYFGSDETEDALKEPTIKKAYEAAVIETFGNKLDSILTEQLGEQLKEIYEEEELCNEIKESTPEKFAKPDF